MGPAPLAMFTKVLGCGLGAFRFGPTIAIRVGTGMMPRGEFWMVVAQAGLELKAISVETYSLIVFMAITVAVFDTFTAKGVRPDYYRRTVQYQPERGDAGGEQEFQPVVEAHDIGGTENLKIDSG